MFWQHDFKEGISAFENARQLAREITPTYFVFEKDMKATICLASVLALQTFFGNHFRKVVLMTIFGVFQGAYLGELSCPG